MPARLSAVKAISPAFAQTRRLLFEPFRWGHWLRLALVGLLTGEFMGGGWGGSTSVSVPGGGTGAGDDKFSLLAASGWGPLGALLPWLLVLVAAVVVLALLFLYISSVFRFLLLDAVLTGRCELGSGWSRWEEAGRRFFFWQLTFALVFFLALGVVVGIPLYYAWRAGWFEQPERHVGVLILGGLGIFLLVGVLTLAGMVIAVLAKDFLVPVMALENLGVVETWRRLLPMLNGDKLNYTGYMLMKVVLGIGSAVLFGIVNIFVLLLFLIPAGIVGAVVVVWAKGVGFSWGPYTIVAAVAAGLLVLAGMFFLMALVYVPGLVFFQSYVLQFFGGRYPALGALLERSSPSSPFGPRAAPVS